MLLQVAHPTSHIREGLPLGNIIQQHRPLYSGNEIRTTCTCTNVHTCTCMKCTCTCGKLNFESLGKSSIYLFHNSKTQEIIKAIYIKIR